MFKRQARARFAKGEATLQPIVKRAIDAHLAVLRREFAALPDKALSGDSHLTAAAAAPIPEIEVTGHFADPGGRPQFEIVDSGGRADLVAEITELYGADSPLLDALTDGSTYAVARNPATGRLLSVASFTVDTQSTPGRINLQTFATGEGVDKKTVADLITHIREDNPTLPMKMVDPAPTVRTALAAGKPSKVTATDVTWVAFVKDGQSTLQKDSIDNAVDQLNENSARAWEATLDAEIMPALGEQLDGVLRAGMSRPEAHDRLLDWRREYLDARRQELVDVPDEITSQLRTRLSDLADELGTTVDDARDAAQEMLDEGYPSWENRAQLIARTETVGANNQGSLESMSAMAELDGIVATKTWLATSDSKTRADHAEIDGTTVPLDGTFDVGGVAMNGPGDNAGGAAQVCNCRCTLTYEFPEDPTADLGPATWPSPDGDNPVDNGLAGADTAGADTLLTAGAIDQPRDAHGRFGSGGSSESPSFAGNLAVSGTQATALLDEARGGGFTYDVAGKSSPTTGFSVSPYPERTQIIETKDLSAGQISDYADKNADLLSQPGHMLGGWRETKADGTDRVWLDVTIVSQDQNIATATAKAHDQVAIFDLSTGTTIDTGGTGGTGSYGYQARSREAYEARAGGPPGGPPRRAGPDQTEGQAEEVAPAPTGVAVMAKLSAGDAARAAVPDGEAPDALHVTLGYLANPAADYDDAARADILARLAGISGPITADAFATAHFNPEDDERDPCAVILVQSAGLAAAHDAVTEALGSDASTTFPVWIPHVTIAYNADPSVIPAGVVGGTVTFDRVVVGWAGDEIPLGLDGPGDTGGDTLTAATEAPVTAPTTTAPPAAPLPADSAAPLDVPDAALEPTGITWSGPVARLGIPASDGRIVSPDGGTIRTLPRPLSWQRSTAPEHDGAVVVGRILSVEPRGDELWATGDWLDPMLNFDTASAMAQVDAGLGFASLDLAVTMMGFADPDTGQPIDPALYDGDGDVSPVAIEWELGGITIVSFEAFANCRITNTIPDPALGDSPPVDTPGGGLMTFAAEMPEAPTISDDGSTITLNDGSTITVGDPIGYPSTDGDGDVETGTISAINVDDATVTITPDVDADDAGVQGPDLTVNVADLQAVPDGVTKPGDDTALLASSEVRPYRSQFFLKRKLEGPTPITVDPSTGEVYGHLAAFNTCHMGKLAETGLCTTAPREPNDDYSYFHLSPVLTDEGLLDVGKVTLGAAHARRGGHQFAVQHYENTAYAAALVRAYTDEFGIQVTGQVIHDTPAARVEELMRSPLSGDWRKVEGKFRLAAALAVNTPGFPVRRPQVGMSGDEQISLVAAGVVEIPEGRELDEIVLPSGQTISVDDFEALTAAASAVMDRRNRGEDVMEDELALRRARLRVNLSGRRRSAS